MILITLTDVELAVRLNALLEQQGIETTVVSPLDDVLGVLRKSKPKVVVVTGAPLDPGSVALVHDALWAGAAVVGFPDVGDPEVEARLRAMGYVEVLSKPVPADEAAALVRRLLDRQRLAEVTGLYGESRAIREVLVKLEQIAPVSSTVLIEGESGTGKELVARAVHRLSPRRAKPFIAVNVGALPETLLESELFGHEKGAFTGAAERRLGRFELADEGTLFLDEIGEVPTGTQVKLLRVLEDGVVTRVGGTTPIEVNVRVVAATNRPLRQQVEEGTFRADLYYRLNVLSIYLPPLRERREDIGLLVRRFVSEFSRLHDRPFRGISAEAMQALTDYSWPGNVRELRNLIESMVVLAPGRAIGLEDIPREIREGRARLVPVLVGSRGSGIGEEARGRELEFIVRTLLELRMEVEELRRRVEEGRDRLAGGAYGVEREGYGEVSRTVTAGAVGTGVSVTGVTTGDTVAGSFLARATGALEPPGQAAAGANVVVITPGMTMAEIERRAIEAALRETRGNRRKAAELLQIGERTMYRKLKEYELGGSGEGA